ncbi:2-succinyl-5-enolpyruvyl-6-hydroxy-3-cyclohexene-1-carboxylate synthase [Microbacterium sp. SORGH_AS 421]|nr:2-succinyl-5-enolpyruvyl-6-hydroxy-3-cyclohexene-1-carboxylate synthase [Microbacterium sp. SORGH_AS_0421]
MPLDTRRAAAPATDAAAALLAGLVSRGVRHLVVSPGSRSQALALVAAELERQGLVHLHVRIDERVAGFTALGIGRETGMPAVVVCTSGTAVANLVPAALEAHHAGVPLLLLTADRPPELRGVGANQTTRQPGLFRSAVRLEADLAVPAVIDGDATSEQTAELDAVAASALAAALGEGARAAGPVHLNVPFREPLAGAAPSWLAERAASGAHPAEDDADGSGALYQGGGGIGEADVAPEVEAAYVIEPGPRTVVIAGADAGAAAEQVAHDGGFPLIAEIVSGSRFGRQIVHGYRALVDDPALGGRVERVVVFGRPTLSREVTRLLMRDDVEVLAVRGPGEPVNLNGTTQAVDAVRVGSGENDRAWLGEWMRASRARAVDLSPPAPDADGLASAVPHERLGAINAEVEVMRAPLDRPALVDALWRATWPHDRLVFGSSRIVRVADEVLGGKKVAVHSNRGLAGHRRDDRDGHRCRSGQPGRGAPRCDAPAARRSRLPPRHRRADAASRRDRTAPAGRRRKRRRGHDLRRSRGGRGRRRRRDGPRAVHPAHGPSRAARPRLRVGVPPLYHARRTRPGADCPYRRPAADRGPPPALNPGRQRVAIIPDAAAA